MYGLAERLVKLCLREESVRSAHLLSIGAQKWASGEEGVPGRSCRRGSLELVILSSSISVPLSGGGGAERTRRAGEPVQLLKQDSGFQEDLEKVWVPKSSSDSVTGTQRT